MAAMKPEAIERLIERGRDDYTARLAAGQARAAAGDPERAVEHLERAVDHDPDQAVAWQWLGKLRLELGRTEAAAEAWRQGIAAAAARGDVQAEKVMRVWLRRLERAG